MKILFAAAVPFVLASCAQTPALPDPASLIQAADPSTARVAPPGPTVTYHSRPIAEPEDWRQLNDRQAPGGSS